MLSSVQIWKYGVTLAQLLRQELGHGLPDPKTQPLANDDTSELDEKWSEWVAAESYKRYLPCIYLLLRDCDLYTLTFEG